MIGKQDILDRATEWQLRPEVVEKDYILGWVLAALASHLETRDCWILKGGTCIKKCYVETYRFSEDLDFSLLRNASYSEAVIRETLAIIARIGSELSGVDFPEDMIQVRARRDKLGRPTFEGRIAYRGPLGVPARFPTALPRVLFDITHHEPVFDPPSPRIPFHPYPDLLPDGLSVLTYSLNELLAEKVRALYERTRPRDLYDVVYLLENQPGAFDFLRICELFGMKCTAKQFEAPLAADLLRVTETTEELRTEWEHMLAHQLPNLPKLDDLLFRLPALLRWIDEPAAVLPEMALASAPTPAGESLVAATGIQYWGNSLPLEVIRFAGANRLLIEFVYNGARRLVEPYSLRQSSVSNLLLHGWEQGSMHIKAFNISKMREVRSTNIAFQPRYRVEFTSAGPLSAPPTAAPMPQVSHSGQRPRQRRRRQPTAFGPTYVFLCPYCQKQFRHSKNDSRLRKHKTLDGLWDCSGRKGYLMSIE
jgi:predicted nucleotidyltransferase component of viral defense system